MSNYYLRDPQALSIVTSLSSGPSGLLNPSVSALSVCCKTPTSDMTFHPHMQTYVLYHVPYIGDILACMKPEGNLIRKSIGYTKARYVLIQNFAVPLRILSFTPLEHICINNYDLYAVC